MSKPKDKKPAAKPKTETASPKEKKAGRARVRWVSSNAALEGWWVRSFKDITDQFGPPCDPEGNKCVEGGTLRGGMSPADRAKRTAEKAEEKKRIDAMSDEEKLSYAKAKREERQAKTKAKKTAEREALIAQIKAEIAAGKL